MVNRGEEIFWINPTLYCLVLSIDTSPLYKHATVGIQVEIVWVNCNDGTSLILSSMVKEEECKVKISQKLYLV